MNLKKFYNIFKYLIILIISLSTSHIYAADSTIGFGTETTQQSIGAEDTLTVAEGATLDYDGYYSVDADGITFNAAKTQITNHGTIQNNQNFGINISNSTNPSIVNTGTITNDAANKGYPIYASQTVSGSVTNSGTIQPHSTSSMAMYVAQTTNFTVTNNNGGTIHGRGNYAVYYYAATSPTLTNNSGGTVTSTGSYAAQFSNSSNITLTNAGTISSGDDYPVFIGDTTGTNRITNTGTISATDDYGIWGYEANNVTITNSGTISAGDNYGISLSRATGTNSVTNQSGGTISATDDYALDLSRAADIDVTNAGTISAGEDAAIYITYTDDFEITNSGSITAGGDYGFFIYGDVDNGTITNSGTIDVVAANAIYAGTGSTGTMVITNSGTLRSGTNPISYNGSGNMTITNSGTIEADNAGYTDNLSNITSNSTITNTGSVTGGRYGFTPKSNATGITFTNKTGTINGSTYDIYGGTEDWGTFTNGQGGNDCVKYYSYLPATYKIYVASTSSYGKMCNTAGTSYSRGDIDFVVDTSSSLSAGTTYSDVFTGAVSSNFNSTSGTCVCSNGTFNWTLSDADGNNNWDLVVTADTTAPTLSSSSPADNATGVAVDANIVLTFSEAVDAESGNITIKKTSDNSTIETIDVTGAKVSGSGGTQITVNPATNWDQKTEYYVLIDATAFDDGSSNSYAGISSTTALSFTTIDSTNPSLSSSKPADNGTSIKIDANIVLTFSEAVDAESGNITIKLSSDDSTIEAIDVTGNNVSGSGSTTITINPSSDLKNGKEYYILIASTAFDDATGNSYAGISSKTALNFKTQKGEIFSKTVKTLTKNQSRASVKTMSQSITRISSRMNYIRPSNTNTFRQNIRLAMNFDDPFANQLFDSLARKFLKPKKETKGWAVWTEGNVSFGRIGHHDGNLGQDIHSDGLTFGIDKKITENKTVGFAINKGWQDVEVGSGDAYMDAAAISLMTYSSFKLKESTYFETAIGIGEMDIDLDRSVTEGRNKGIRKGNQLFGSFTYLLEPDIEDEEKNLNYYTRVDLGFTQLDPYTETGDGTAVHYNRQNVKSASLSVGFNLRKMIEIENGILTPHLKFEIGKDKTINSLSEAYYINDTSTIYTNAIADQNSEHALLSLGLGAQLNGDLTINISYDHYRSTDHAFNNSFTINLRKSF